jgi:prepilin-type N-terminal cleavage/methylation domain-containing protein
MRCEDVKLAEVHRRDAAQRAAMIVRASRRGFTLVELSMGMLIMTIILAALGGLAVALTSGWKATEVQDGLQIARRQTSAQMYHNVRSAKFIGAATADKLDSSGPGPRRGAAVMFWKGDKDPGPVMYAYQIGVIEHDLDTSTLRLYQLPQTASGAMTPFKAMDIDDQVDVDAFKGLPGATCQIIGRNVHSVTFKLLPISSTRQTQSMEFRIQYKSGEQEQLEYGTATLRGPQAPQP